MSDRKLIFFTTSDPSEDPGAFFRVYHFANVAGNSGLEAEVRLAGNAVDVVDPNTLPATSEGDDVRAKVAAGPDGPFEVTL